MYWCRVMAPSTTTSSLLPHGGFHPITWLTGHDFHHYAGHGHQSASPLAYSLRRTQTRPSLWYRENRDASVKIQCLHCLRSHTLCLLPRSRQCRLCSKVSLGHLAGHRDQYPVARSHLRIFRTDIRLPNLHLQTRSRDEAVRSDHSEQLTVFPWCGHFHWTSTLPLMWSASLSVASQNFAYASLRHPQHPGYFSLRIAICQQSGNLLQYLLWQILWHNPF